MKAIVGLTGGIGSGKSLIAKVFAQLGVATFCADDEAKKMYADENVKQQIIELFGATIYIDDKNIDKKMLAAKIFADKEILTKVNSIVHPALYKHFEIWAKTQPSKFVILESAILFDSGFDKYCSQIINVCAPTELRIKRCMTRDNSSRQQVLARMQNQMSDEQRNAQANFTIINDEKTPLLPQIEYVNQKISEINNF